MQKITFLGIDIDTVGQTSHLPEAKLLDLRSQLNYFMQQHKVTLWELQQLVGHLNFVCKLVALGRVFLRKWLFLAHLVTAQVFTSKHPAPLKIAVVSCGRKVCLVLDFTYSEFGEDWKVALFTYTHGLSDHR